MVSIPASVTPPPPTFRLSDQLAHSAPACLVLPSHSVGQGPPQSPTLSFEAKAPACCLQLSLQQSLPVVQAMLSSRTFHGSCLHLPTPAVFRSSAHSSPSPPQPKPSSSVIPMGQPLGKSKEHQRSKTRQWVNRLGKVSRTFL